MSHMLYDLGKELDQNWLVAEEGFSAGTLGKGESLFCQGNGYMNQRAALHEEYVNQTRNLFVAGTFHRFNENEVTELPNLPDLTRISFDMNGNRFSLDTGKVIRSMRYLYLKTGEVVREIEWESPTGIRLRLLFRRFVSLDNEHIIAFRLEITPLSQGISLRMESGINGRVSNSGSQHFCEGDMRIYDGNILEMNSRACNSDLYCCLHAAHRFRLDHEDCFPKGIPMIDRRYLGYRYNMEIPQNRTLSVDKICCVHTSRDLCYENERGDVPALMKETGLTLARESLETGYDALFAKSQKAWKRYWDMQDIEILSDRPYDQLAIRFALYHLRIMVNTGDSRVGIGAKGLTGESYKGHSFWDTEIFLLPFYFFTQPQTARTLLIYRFKSLQSARNKARENGFRGAMYPWETAGLDDGEVTPLWGAADVVTGHPLPILTGLLEQHITADVAYAVWQYYLATGDQTFLDEYGYEILLETGRFWASRVTFDENRQAYVILDVIGPDEYKEHVNNNAYTNYLAYYNMRLALAAMDALKSRGGSVYQRLSGIIPFDEARKEISDAVSKLYLPRENQEGLIPQFDGYFDLSPVDLKKYKNTDIVGTLFHDYNMEQIGKMQVSKQGDLMVLMLLLGELFSPDLLAKNFPFYEERTLHDSSLSKSTHCVLACDLEWMDTARKFFLGACDTDLGPVMTTSDMGIHSAAMGGIWQCVVFGFGGVRVRKNRLNIAPHLLEEWKNLAFPLCFQGQRMYVEADRRGVTVCHSGNRPVSVTIYHKEYVLQPGQKVTVEKTGEDIREGQQESISGQKR